jgi:hypothetical protein
MKIVVISGLIETKLVKRLREAGNEIIAASPRSGVNSITGDGLFGRHCFVWPIGVDQTSPGFYHGDAQ